MKVDIKWKIVRGSRLKLSLITTSKTLQRFFGCQFYVYLTIVSKQLDIVRSLAGSLKIGNVAPDSEAIHEKSGPIRRFIHPASAGETLHFLSVLPAYRPLYHYPRAMAEASALKVPGDVSIEAH